MNEKLKALLKKLGMSDEQIQKFSTDDKEALNAIIIDDEYQSVVGKLTNTLENDADFVRKFEQAARGKVLSSKENKILKLFTDFLGKDQIDALPKETRFDSMLELLHSQVEEKIAAGAGTPEEIQKKIDTLNTTVRELKADNERYESEVIPTIKNEYQSKEKTMQSRFDIMGKIKRDEIVGDFNAMGNLIVDGVLTKYDIGENNVLLQKGSELKATKDHEDLTLDDAISESIESLGIRKQSNNGGGNRDKVDPEKDVTDKTQGPPMPGVNAAQKRAAEFAEKAKGSSEE